MKTICSLQLITSGGLSTTPSLMSPTSCSFPVEDVRPWDPLVAGPILGRPLLDRIG